MTGRVRSLACGVLLTALAAPTGLAQTQPGGATRAEPPGGRVVLPRVVSSGAKTISASRLPSSMVGLSAPSAGPGNGRDPLADFSARPTESWLPTARWKKLFDNNKAVMAGGGVLGGAPGVPTTPAPQTTMAVGYGPAPNPLSATSLRGKVVRLMDAAYALPSIAYNATVRNVSSFVVQCAIWSKGRFGGVYAIGPGAQLDYPMETAASVIEMQCPDVRGGARLTGVAHGKRYIFKRKAILPIQTGVTMLGSIEFYEVT